MSLADLLIIQGHVQDQSSYLLSRICKVLWIRRNCDFSPHMYQEKSIENPGQITSSKVRKQAKQGLEPKTVIWTFLQFFSRQQKKLYMGKISGTLFSFNLEIILELVNYQGSKVWTCSEFLWQLVHKIYYRRYQGPFYL